MSSESDALRAAYESAGQGHVFQFWDSLDESQRSALTGQLKVIDPHLVNEIFKKTISSAAAPTSGTVAPLPKDRITKLGELDPEVTQNYRTLGLQMIARGQVAVLLLAGGQGTRLGSADPKGMYNIGLPSGKSLYQFQAERVLRIQELAARSLPAGETSVPLMWYVMTSPFTYNPTVDFFTRHNFFGLRKDQIVFFNQGFLPCVGKDGKILMEDRGSVATAPDGNGGVYAALRREGVLDDLKRRNVKYVHVYCVDNILVKIADPLFVGSCAIEDAECGAKVIPKAYPEEAVGVYCYRGGRCDVVEYSELPKDLACARDESGELLFNSANIVQHLFRIDFLDRCCNEWQVDLTYHVAEKKIRSLNADGVPVTPTSPNGIKLESFIFDTYRLASGTVRIVEGSRAEDFAPVKNAEGAGKDSPDTARAMVNVLSRKWIEKAGGSLTGDSNSIVEISPLLSYDGEDLAARFSGQSITGPVEFH